MNIKVLLQKHDSVLVTKFDLGYDQELFEYNSSIPREAASLSKIYLALDTIERLDKKEITNKVVSIRKKDVAGYGTDVLTDLLSVHNQIKLDILTLVGLMIKYSCNSSAAILANRILSPRSELEKRAANYWKLKNVNLVSKHKKIENLFSLRDIQNVYRKIYLKKGPLWDFLRERLGKSRNIYYLFDQQNLNILGSKSGTVFKDGYYWISDTGVIEIKGGRFFLGAVIRRKKISTAVRKIREVGKIVVTQL